MNFGYSSTFQSIDKGLIERVGPTGFVITIFNLSSNFISFCTGYPFKAIFVIVCSTFIFITFYFAYIFGFFLSFCISYLLLIFSFLIISLLTT
jgi:hypothetical protein